MWFWKKKNRQEIALIEVNGAIAAAARTDVLKAIEIVKERQFPALLLRVDSPGGTVGDCYEIYRALQKLQEKVKIVVSMGNIAASGGVYISMGAQHIVANPGTIVGSIGVILRGNNIEKLLDRVGISFKTIKSGPYKDILSFDRPLTDSERQILQDLIDGSYSQFVKTVAAGRNLAEEKVREFADGRIFTGEDAVGLGLVDRLGTQEDARLWAVELAGLDEEKAKLVAIEPNKTGWSRFIPGRRASINSLAASFPAIKSTTDWLEFELATSGLPLWLYR
jgi:protease IV